MDENIPDAPPARPTPGLHDVVVVGGGAAGLSAALVLTRARRDVVVVDAGRPRNAPASHMQGFLGSDGMPPSGLLAAGRAEVAGYGGRVVDATATAIVRGRSPHDTTPGEFRVRLGPGESLRARRVLVTTGLRDVVPDIPGVQERWGRDLLHCPYCHGYEVRDQPLGVLVAPADGVREALAHVQLVRQWSGDVILFANGARLTAVEHEQLAARGIRVVEEGVVRLLVEDDHLDAVELADGRTVPRAALFVRPTFVANDALLAGLGCATGPGGWVSVDPTGLTSVPGVWAAGNAVNPRAQVITAAGEGSAAAIAINNDLVDEDGRTALATYRLGRHG